MPTVKYPSGEGAFNDIFFGHFSITVSRKRIQADGGGERVRSALFLARAVLGRARGADPGVFFRVNEVVEPVVVADAGLAGRLVADVFVGRVAVAAFARVEDKGVCFGAAPEGGDGKSEECFTGRVCDDRVRRWPGPSFRAFVPSAADEFAVRNETCKRIKSGGIAAKENV